MDDPTEAKVLVAELLDDTAIARLSEVCAVDVRYGLSHEDMCAAFPAYDAIIVRSETQVDKEFLEAASRLRIVGRAGSGLDNIDVPYATQRGVIVCNTPESAPGVIGRVATIMGEHHVNISRMVTSTIVVDDREESIMMLGVDADVPKAAIDKCLEAGEIHEMRIVHL